MEALKQAICCLSKEIQKISYSEDRLIAKKELGLDYVHEQIKEAPYCSKHQSVVKVLLCRKCDKCYLDGLCSECFKRHELHYLGSSFHNDFIRLC